ncbi:MAG: hypothetical protein ABEJ84_03855 [Halodesulfurarchaeum sp.]
MSRKTRLGDTGIDSHTDDDDQSGSVSRRNLMAAGAAVWATASLAGCSGQTEPTTTTSAPETTTPAAQPENLVVTDEMAATGSFGSGFTDDCAPTRSFTTEMKALWNIKIYDPASGEVLGADTLDSVSVNIEGGPTVDAPWQGGSGEHAAPIWEAVWEIPDDIKMGEHSYTIEITGGDDANFTTVGVSTGTFSIVEDTMPDFYVSTETYWNGHPAPEGTKGFVGTCAPEREFLPSMDVTFYVQVYETETGKIVGAPAPEGTTTSGTTVPEDDASAQKISSTTVESITVKFPNTDKFDSVELEWISGIGDAHTAPHWEGTLTEPETLPTGTYAWEIDIAGVDEADRKIVGAAADQFTVIKQ